MDNIKDIETRYKLYKAFYTALREDLEARVKEGQFVDNLREEDDEAVWNFYDKILSGDDVAYIVVDVVSDVRADLFGVEEDFWNRNEVE